MLLRSYSENRNKKFRGGECSPAPLNQPQVSRGGGGNYPQDSRGGVLITPHICH